MSFMFKPYPFTDPVPVNRIQLAPEVRNAAVMGNAAVAAKLLSGAPNVILLDGYASADFSSLIRNIKEQSAGKKIEVVDFAEVYRSSDELDALLADTLPEDRVIDPILLFGKSHHFTLEDLIDAGKLEAFLCKVKSLRENADLVIIYGQASLQPCLKEIADVTAFLDVTPCQCTPLSLHGR